MTFKRGPIQHYNIMVSRASKVFACPECRVSMLPKEYQSHCTRNHGLDSKIQCVWCRGAMSWPKGTKQDHADHLKRCFQKFIRGQVGDGGSILCGTERYRIEVNRSSQIWTCADCGAVMLPKDVESHFARSHPPLHPKTHCVWCKGAVSWPMGEKHRHMDHLILCFRACLQSLEAPSDPLRDATPPLPFDTTPQSDTGRFWHHRRLRDLPERAYGPVWPMEPPDDPSNGLTFEGGESLQWAVSYVRYFVRHRDEIELFHVMVKANIFENFLLAMDADGGCTRTLPFSCWCDGGHEKTDRYRQHRHLIVVAPKGHFLRQVWARVKRPRDVPRKNFPCLREKPIAEPLHLVNALGYVCRRASRCNATFDTRLKKSRKNHFSIACTLPRDYRRVLASQWDGGLLQLAKQAIANIDPKKLMAGSRFVGGRWRIRVRDVPGLENVALPVSRAFRVSERPTEHWICLTRGRKLYFEKREEEEGERVSVGVYGVVGGEDLVPRPKHQTFLTNVQLCMEPIRKEMERLRGETERLRGEMERLRGEMEVWQREAERWKREAEAMEQVSATLWLKNVEG